jgi:nicotinamidase-related amidase
MSARELPLPPHFNPARVGEVWPVRYSERAVDAEAWSRQHGIAPASEDTWRTCLLLVDCQNTFCLPVYELFVAGRSGRGAIDDNIRLCEFIYRNLPSISRVIATLDTHSAFQIFHPIFWVNDNGEHPAGQTIISLADVEHGRWRVNAAVAPAIGGDNEARLQRYSEYYVRRLTESGKYPLMIWPYHAMLGGTGHALVAAVEEAVFFHGIARRSVVQYEIKGESPWTEHYSVFNPEVREDHEGQPLTDRGRDIIQTLSEYERIIIAGQAKSHCVAWSIDDLLSEARVRDPSLVNRIHLLEDCMSPVVVPGVVDFTEQADAAFARFSKAGIQIVRSTWSMERWPGTP